MMLTQLKHNSPKQIKAPEAHLRHIVLLNIDDMGLVRVRSTKAPSKTLSLWKATFKGQP